MPPRLRDAVFAAIFAALQLSAASRAAQPAPEPPALTPSLPETCYLFSSFRGNGEDGLHLAWSTDGLAWTPLHGDRAFLRPEIGGRLMRDPHILQGPDGTFHMVWTVSWTDRVIGYANSRDLLTWSPQRAIPVMMHEPTARNCWAPELAYDAERGQFLIFWSTTIPGRFPGTDGTAEEAYDHRIYCTTTRDFEMFTPTRLFYDGGFNAIDATILRDGPSYYLFIKDETLKPEARKHLQVARSERLEGPYAGLSAPFTESWVEGPSAIKIGGDYLVYFDSYRKQTYGAMRSRDLVTWEDISPRVSFPPGTRHGTAFAVHRDVVQRLLDAGPAGREPATTPAAP